MGEVQYIYRAMDSEDEVQISLDVSIRVLWKPNIIIARRTPLQDPPAVRPRTSNRTDVNPLPYSRQLLRRRQSVFCRERENRGRL